MVLTEISKNFYTYFGIPEFNSSAFNVVYKIDTAFKSAENRKTRYSPCRHPACIQGAGPGNGRKIRSERGFDGKALGSDRHTGSQSQRSG